jgi:hypothetical protein
LITSVMAVMVSWKVELHFSLSEHWLFMPSLARGSIYLSRLARECFRCLSLTHRWQMSLSLLQASSKQRKRMVCELWSEILQKVVGGCNIKFIPAKRESG